MSFKDKCRVGIVYRMDHPGGVQSVALALIRGLNQAGIKPDIIWDLPPNSEYLRRHKAEAGYYPIRFKIPTRRIDRLPASVRYLAHIINCYNGSDIQSKFDFLYIFWNGFLINSALPHLRYLSGPPLLPQLIKNPAGVRGLPFRFFRWLYQKYLFKSHPVYEYHQRDQYVINSEYTAGLFKDAHQVQLPIVYPPITFSDAPLDWEDIGSRDSVTFFSRIVDYKRPDLMISVAERFPQWRCVVMGGVPDHRRGYFDHLKEIAERHNLSNLEFIANPENARVQGELSRCRCYFFPAHNEHFGMTTVEAIAHGALPLVHNSGGQREIVPLADLRFEDHEIFEKLDRILSMPNAEQNQVRLKLTRHIQQFGEAVSVGQLLSYLPPKG